MIIDKDNDDNRYCQKSACYLFAIDMYEHDYDMIMV